MRLDIVRPASQYLYIVDYIRFNLMLFCRFLLSFVLYSQGFEQFCNSNPKTQTDLFYHHQ